MVVIGGVLVGLAYEGWEPTGGGFAAVATLDRAANAPSRLDHPEHPHLLGGPPSALQHAALSTGVSTGTLYQVG